MKKLMISLLFFCFICSACGKNKAEITIPTIIEPTIEEINKAKKSVAVETINNIIRTASLYYVEQQIDASYVPQDLVIDFSGTIPEDFVFSGAQPTSGKLIIDTNGNVSISDVIINDYTCNKNEENKIVCE